ncbi:MAG: endo-1,4-beta-xylanase [Sedimentisphaerales bacterium]|nr:endo-1,4-beta-xylanase [Sedimentisphaerales bacterium]
METQNTIPALKNVFRNDFVIGAALSIDQLTGKEPDSIALVEKHFNTITPENIMKWEVIHPEPDKYNFEPADLLVSLAQKNNMQVVGHNLVWHNQTPKWVFEDNNGKPLSRNALLDRMKEHIFTVMGRYKGKIFAWDVVNEAIIPDGQYRRSKWFDIIGQDYLVKAYEFAREADPSAELYYNEYNMWKVPQCVGVISLIRYLQSNGVKVDGLGIQGHWALDVPTHEQLETQFKSLSTLGIKLMITELDVCVLPFADDYHNLRDLSSLPPEEQKRMSPYPDGMPEVVQKRLADRYVELFSMFLKYNMRRVTFWGVQDGQSWRSYMPIRGRKDYPLLFDRQCRPKTAFDAVVKLRQ